MSRLYLLLTPLLFLTGCCTNQCTQPPIVCQRCRPNTALIPLVNNSNCAVQWDISHEITNEVVDSMLDRSTLNITPLAHYRGAIDQIAGADLFGKDLSFANHFASNDFLVLMELVKHDTVPYNKEHFPHITSRRSSECHSVLELGVRLRVLDLRSEEPRIVLQEFVECDQLITKRAAQIDYSLLDCESKSYHDTPLALAHQVLAQEIAEKVEYATLSHW